MNVLARTARLEEIAECDRYLARGDEQLVWLCERVEQLRTLQATRLARKDRLLLTLREGQL